MKTIAPYAVLLAFLPLVACAPASEESGKLTPPGGHADGLWFEGSYAEALAQAKATNRHVFVDFWTTWCGYCKQMDKGTFPDAEVRAELGRMIALSVDAESAAGKPIADKYHANGFPTLVVLGADGKELGRHAGYLTADEFVAWLEKVNARAKR